MSSLRARFPQAAEKYDNAVDAVKSIEREDVSTLVGAHVAGISTTHFTFSALTAHLPEVMDGLNWAADNYIGGKALIGRLTTEAFNAAHAVRNGVEISKRTIAENLTVDVLAAGAFGAGYTYVNSLLGRKAEDNHPALEALLVTEGTAVTASALRQVGKAARFLYEKAPTISVFGKKNGSVTPPLGYENLADKAGLGHEDLEAGSTAPKAKI